MGLDTRLPMYLEDQEICHRARTLGYRVVVCRTVQARHVGGASRKSHTGMARQLRMMELAAAPCMSLMDETGHRLRQLRVLVVAAGLVRVGVAAATAVTPGWCPDGVEAVGGADPARVVVHVLGTENT